MFKPFKAKVGEQTFDLTTDKLSQLDSITNSDGSLHVLKDGKAYQVEVEMLEAKSFEVILNGNKYIVDLQDEQDLLVERLGLSVRQNQVTKEIKAPMPGLVLSTEVEAGQSVEAGDALLILEAMKMENVIKAPADGVVKNIQVKKGDAVEKGTILLAFE